MTDLCDLLLTKVRERARGRADYRDARGSELHTHAARNLDVKRRERSTDYARVRPYFAKHLES